MVVRRGTCGDGALMGNASLFATGSVNGLNPQGHRSVPTQDWHSQALSSSDPGRSVPSRGDTVRVWGNKHARLLCSLDTPRSCSESQIPFVTFERIMSCSMFDTSSTGSVQYGEDPHPPSTGTSMTCSPWRHVQAGMLQWLTDTIVGVFHDHDK